MLALYICVPVQAASVEGPLNDALRTIESARSRLENAEDHYSGCGVKDAGVSEAIDDAGRAVVAAEHVQQVRGEE